MITRYFDLWITQGHTKRLVFNANQYDSGETWKFRVLDADGSPLIPTTAAIIGQKKDGHAILVNGTIGEDGRVTIVETEQMTACAGLTEFELLLNGETHGTANFTVQVEKRPGDDADLSDSDLSLIQDAVDAAEIITEVIGDGDPSEVIGEHVDAWLDNHPEATTTVQDGAITAPKINQSLWDKLLVSEEASGAVASFDDGADDVPVSSLKVALEPIQFGSGDPSPSNIRPIIAANGKNLFHISDISVSSSGVTYTYDANTNTLTKSGTSSGSVGINTQTITVPNGTYTFSADFSGESGSPTSIYLRDASTNTNVGSISAAAPNMSATLNGTYYIRLSTNTGATSGSISKFQLESGSSVSPYQPYQGIMVERCGRNLFDIGGWLTSINASFTITNDGFYNLTPNSAAYSSKFAIPSGIKTVSCVVGADTVATNVRVRCTKADGTFTDIYNGQSLTDNITGISLNWSVEGLISIKVMAEMGSVASAYVPYIGTSYPYTLGQNVYGGTVDLATGVLTVTWGTITLDGSESWQGTPPSGWYVELHTLKKYKSNYVGAIYADKLVTGRGQEAISGYYDNRDTYPNQNWLYYYNNTFTTTSEVKSYFQTNPTQIVYELATPTAVQLTPTEVKTLLGYNNISSSGTVDVIYHADTKLYVDKMTNVDNAIIAPTEETFTATRNYTTNDLVIVADTLYKVTANIASGSAITPNSNVQQTTLSALIKALS